MRRSSVLGLLVIPLALAPAHGGERMRLEHLTQAQRDELGREPALREFFQGPQAAARFAELVDRIAASDAERARDGLDYDLPGLVAYTCADPGEPEMGPFARRYDRALLLAREARSAPEVEALLAQDPDRIRPAMLRSVLARRGVLDANDERALGALEAACQAIDRFVADEQAKLDRHEETHDEHFTDWGLKTTTLTAFPMKIGLLTDRIVRRLKGVPRGAAAPVTAALVVGPGIDVANHHLGPSAPVCVYQPFELQASLLAHGLAKEGELRIDCLDINPLVIKHLDGAIARARSGASYPLEVFAFDQGPFAFADARDYVLGFLRGIPGAARRPSPARVSIESFAKSYEEARRDAPAGTVPSDVVERLRTEARLSVVHVDVPPAAVACLRAIQGDVIVDLLPEAAYDVILCTNLLVYFEPGPRALAVANMARALKPGGVLICTDRLVAKPGERTLGMKHIHSELHGRFDPQYVYQKE